MTGLEALDNLVQSCFNPCDSDEVLNDKAIVEKELKALEIIKKKTVDIWLIQNKKTLKQYNSMVDESRQLTEEEFDLLKEVLE